MREILMQVLAEPGTGAPLRLEAGRRDGDQILDGQLVSTVSGKIFPIVDGIPRFVEGATYTDSFGFQWNRFREVQVDSATKVAHSQQRFDTEAGWSERDLAGKWLLDAGCGAGRFAEIAAARGPNLVALDFSSAVVAAARTLQRFPNAHVVQASLLDPPFRPDTFDFAYCIGVAQHTPDPKGAVAKVVGAVRPGGKFSMSIYARRIYSKLNSKYLIRPITRRLPEKVLLKAIERTMPFFFPITEGLYGVPYVGRVARFILPVASYPEHTGFTREQRYREAVLDTFDMLSPRYDSPMTWQEVDAVLREVGARSWDFRTRVPINVVGER